MRTLLSTPPRRPIGRGFTLLEMIVATAIMVILVGTMASTITIAFKSKSAAERAVEMTRDTQVVGDVWVNTVSNCVWPDPSFTLDGQSSTDTTATTSGIQVTTPIKLDGPFYGDNANLWLYTSDSDTRAPLQMGVRYVEFGVDQVNGVNCFVQRVNKNLLSDLVVQNADGVRQDLQQEVLVRNVLDVQFQYFDGTNWQDTWDSTQVSPALPFAVKMQLTIAPAHDGDEPRIITRCATVFCAQQPPDTTDTTGITGIGG